MAVDKYKTGSGDAGKRVDVFVSEQLPSYSRASLKALFDNRGVFAGKVAIKAGHKLKEDELVSVDTTNLSHKPRPIKLSIIYEDENVVVIYKPAGLLTHSKGAINNEPTVASFIADKISDKELVGNRAGIVHRLDRDTSGVIITAKNKDALKYLQKQFASRKVKKKYLAIAKGTLSPEEAIIDAPIGRDRKDPKKFTVTEEGKCAQTHYKTKEIFDNSGKTYSFIELQPATGRTHQLRVHLKHLGHPIVGDKYYGEKSDNNSLKLHASSLELRLPNGKTHKFLAKTPQDFRDIQD